MNRSLPRSLPTLNGLRALATIGIFLFHSGFLLKGTFPVTLFFMLSGFFMYYTKYDTIQWSTGLRKIKSFYPLHVITFFVSLLVGKIWIKWNGIETVKSAILNLLLLQTWVPKYALTYNALSWYLSITFFLYLISYPLVKLVRKISHTVVAAVFVVGLIIFVNNCSAIAEMNLYLNPVYRILDYILGMFLAKTYIYIYIYIIRNIID